MCSDLAVRFVRYFPRRNTFAADYFNQSQYNSRNMFFLTCEAFGHSAVFRPQSALEKTRFRIFYFHIGFSWCLHLPHIKRSYTILVGTNIIARSQFSLEHAVQNINRMYTLGPKPDFWQSLTACLRTFPIYAYRKNSFSLYIAFFYSWGTEGGRWLNCQLLHTCTLVTFKFYYYGHTFR